MPAGTANSEQVSPGPWKSLEHFGPFECELKIISFAQVVFGIIHFWNDFFKSDWDTYFEPRLQVLRVRRLRAAQGGQGVADDGDAGDVRTPKLDLTSS